MSHSFSPTSRVLDANSPRVEPLPRHLERKGAARWKEWEPWVWVELRHRGIAPGGSPELARLRQRHSDHIVTLTDASVSMRVIRRHGLDDPRITDEVRALLVREARERQRKAWRARPPSPDPMAQLWGTAIRNRPLSMECPNAPLPNPPSQPGPPVTIAAIQKIVSERFYMRELRNADLQLRSNRQIITFPRQLAIYLARQLTAASLAEIGRQFGGMHHSTVLHSVRKIEGMRRTERNLDRTITGLMETRW